jgi:hypothetical protein
MNLDHEAIRKAYPSVIEIDDTGSKILDASGNPVSVEQSKIDAARVTLDAEYAAVKYKDDRAAEYPDWGTQLDYIYHNGIDKWKTDIVDPVKAKYPKPE